MKRKLIFSVAAMISVFLFFCPVQAQETEKSEKIFNVRIEPGFHWTNWEDYQGKVGEYEDLGEGIKPDFGIKINGQVNRHYFELQGIYYDDEDFFVFADIDLRRIFREELSFFGMPHFFEHDPLRNLNACFCSPTNVPIPAATEFEDLDPDKEYKIKYTNFHSKTTYRLPFLPGSEIYFDYRKEMRKGHRQAIAISKCSSCHVVSRSREIDEYTEDFTPGFKATFGNSSQGWISVDYSYLKRRFGETGDDPRNFYDPAVAPGGASVGQPVFNNRVQYENANLLYDVIPSSEKDSHVFKIHGQLPQITTDVFTSYVNSTTENTHTGNQYDLNSFIGRITSILMPGLSVSGKFRWMDIDNDTVTVSVNEPLGAAGPQAGQTYSEIYEDFIPVFERKSAMNRKIYETELSAKYRLTKQLTLNGQFEWKTTDRDFYDVENGETETTEYRGNLALSFRKAKYYGKINYEHKSISDPFANPQAACNPSGTNVPGATTFTGLQYFQFYDMRELTLSNLPDTIDQISAMLTWSISPAVSLNGYYRYINESNDFEWDRESHMPSISIWFAPSSKLNFSLTYLYNFYKTDSLICEPVFDG